MSEWKEIPLDCASFGPAIVGWAGTPQVMRAFHDGDYWWAISPKKDGSVRAGGICDRLSEPPTHYLPISLTNELWRMADKQKARHPVKGSGLKSLGGIAREGLVTALGGTEFIS